MARRFAFLLVALLVFLAGALFLARALRDDGRRNANLSLHPTPLPTPVVPPTPIPARRVTLYFESTEDERFHPEARDLPAMADDIALLRSVAAAVLEGPRAAGLLRPFPDGWRLRAAFRLKDGLAVLDLEPPPAKRNGDEKAPSAPIRWETGSSEELSAAQSLIVSTTTNLPGLTRFILLVGGEPVETLAGHVDLTHPLAPDLSRVAEEPAVVPPVPSPSAGPPPAPPSPAEHPTAPPRRTESV